MGVNLRDIIIRKEVGFDYLKNKKVAVDSFNCLYQFLASIRGADGTPLKDSNGNITSHLQGLFSRSLNLMSKGIKLVYVFDGEPPSLKHGEIAGRIERKEDAVRKYKDAVDSEDIEGMYKYSKQTIRLTKDMIEESKELVEALGLPCIQAPSEADYQMVYMCKQKDVDCIASTDYDGLLLGVPKLVRNLTLSQKRKVPSGKYVTTFLELITLNDILKELDINQDQLIALGILVGSVDYDEPTLIKDSSGFKLIRIGELYNLIKRGQQSKEIYVPCFNFNDGRISFKRVKHFIKHDINEAIFRIKTDYGRIVKVTASHSLFTFKENKILPVKTTDLKVGDKILIPIKIPDTSENKIDYLNIADLLYTYAPNMKRNIAIDGPSIIKIVKDRGLVKKTNLTDKRILLTTKGITFIKDMGKVKKLAQANCSVSETAIYSWENRLTCPTFRTFSKYLGFLGVDFESFISNPKYVSAKLPSVLEETMDKQMSTNLKYRKTLKLRDISLKEVKNLGFNDKIYSRRETGISVKLKLTKDFIRIVGYYLAEGNSVRDYRLSFNFNYSGMGHDDICVRELMSSIRSVFGIRSGLYDERSGRHVCLDHSVVNSLFTKGLTLGLGSKDKMIPNFVYGLSIDYKLELLRTLFLGDGSLNLDSIAFNTSSKALAEGISYLFLQLGITPSISLDSLGVYKIIICGRDQLLSIKSVWIDHHNSKSLINYVSLCRKRRSKFVPFGDLGIVKVLGIEEVTPTHKSVFDFSVDGENFIAGFGGVCCHNTDYNPSGVKGIGPKKALALIKKYPNVDELFKNVETDFNWEEISNLFKNPIISTNYKLEWNQINIKKIKEILVDRHEFSEERVMSLIEKYKEENKSSDQKGLSDFF